MEPSSRKRPRPSSRLTIASLLCSAPSSPSPSTPSSPSPPSPSRVCAACLNAATPGRSCPSCGTGAFCSACLGAYASAAASDTSLLPLRCGEAACRSEIDAGDVGAVVGAGAGRAYGVALEERKRRRLDAFGSDEEERVVLGVLQANAWQRCPECGTGVERVFGCLHMRCLCGGQFCYGCGGSWVGGVCERRCAGTRRPCMLWEGLRDQIWRRMLQIASRLHEQAEIGVERVEPLRPVPARRRGRGLSVEDIVHSVDAAVVAGSECVGLPSLAVPISPLLCNSLADNRSSVGSHRSMAIQFLMNDHDTVFP